MTYIVTTVARGFLLPSSSLTSSGDADDFAMVVPGLRIGVAYASVRVEQRLFVVVFSFTADEDRAVGAAAASIADRFPDAKIALARSVSLRDGIVRTRVIAPGGGTLAVAAVGTGACASMTSAQRAIVELGDTTYEVRSTAIELGHRAEVERCEPLPEPAPAPPTDATVALLERVTGKLAARFVDPEGAALYREALRDLGIAYRRAGQRDKATAAFQLCASLFDLVLAPTERDAALRSRLELDQRGAPALDLDVERWLRLDREER